MQYISRNVAPTLRPQNKKFSVIIPSAGIGSRMKSYGPKSLLQIPLADTTILHNQLKHINKYLPMAEIIIVAGFEASMIQKAVSNRKNIKVVINENYETTNVVKSIGLGLSVAKNDVIIIYGDLVFNAYTLKAPFGAYSIIITDSYGKMGNKEVGCIVHDHMVERMMYSLPTKWAQIVYLRGRELELLRKICSNKKYDVYFGFEAINIILNSGGSFSAHSPKRMKAMDVDSSRDLELAGSIIK